MSAKIEIEITEMEGSIEVHVVARPPDCTRLENVLSTVLLNHIQQFIDLLKQPAKEDE